MAHTPGNGSATQEDESPSPSRRGGTKRSHSSITAQFAVSHFWDKRGQISYYKQSKSKIQGGINRPINPGRAITTTFLREQKFDDLAALLDFQGWSTFLGKSWEYEPSLIRQFYHNLIPDGDSGEASTSYKSKVYGKIVHISAKALALHFFGSDELDGKCLTEENYTDADACPAYNLGTAVRSLHESDCVDHDSRKASDMTLQNRFLFHILTRVIKPRGGSYSAVTPADAELLYFINNRIKVCLPDMMFQHITRVASRKSSACVYGMALTNYLIEYCQVPSHPSDSICLPDSKIMYTKGQLGWLYNKDPETGEWIRKFHSKGNSTPAIPTPTNADHVASSSAQPREAPQQATQVPRLPTYLDSAAGQVVGSIEDCQKEIVSTLTRQTHAISTVLDRIEQSLTTLSQGMLKVAHRLDTRLSVQEQWLVDIRNSLNNPTRPSSGRKPAR